MTRSVGLSVILAAVLLWPFAASAGDESFSFGAFGRVHLYGGSPSSGVVLFVSGDGGWNKGVVDMARKLSRRGPLVVGVDIRQYLDRLGSAGGSCAYPAADFEALSKYVQKRRRFPRYTLPVLAGYSSGAALVYAVLAQAPPNTFRGGISLGFCPELALRKPLCRGQGLESRPGMPGAGVLFLPDKKLATPWTVLQGAIDEVCSADEARSFVQMVPDGEIIVLPKVGHGFAVERNWLPQFELAFRRLERSGTETGSAALGGLPIVEVPAEGAGPDLLAVVISGDGGWAGLDREVGGELARRGIPVVGLNALQYFWTARTPEGSSGDLARILRHYLGAWSKREALLIGYSLGADVLPFLANRLPADLLDRVREIVLIGPGRTAEFEFHLSEWLFSSDGASSRPVLPEVERLRGRRILCVYGEEEKRSLCPELDRDLAVSERIPGGHHFGGKYEALADLILRTVAAR